MNENTLIRRAQNGHKASFMKLYKLYADRVYTFIIFRINNEKDAEDVLSEVWEKIIINLKDFDGKWENSFKSWIFTIARNSLYDYYKNHIKNLSLETVGQIFKEEPHAEDFYENARIHSFVDRLPPKQAEAVKLKFFQDLKNKEIAVRLHQSEKTVASNLTRALKKLRQWMQ